MTIDVFTFCDFAQDNNGKLTVVGTFNMLSVAKLPSIHQNLFLAIKVTFTPEEAGSHTIKVALEDKSTGEPLLPAFTLTTEKVCSADGRNMSVNLPINAPAVSLEREGTYVGTVTVDDKLQQSTELYVQKRT